MDAGAEFEAVRSTPLSEVESSISSSEAEDGASSYSAARARADARRALMGLEAEVGVSSSTSSSSIRSESASSWFATFVSDVVTASDVAALVILASARFRANSSSFKRFFSSISCRMRSL